MAGVHNSKARISGGQQLMMFDFSGYKSVDPLFGRFENHIPTRSRTKGDGFDRLFPRKPANAFTGKGVLDLHRKLPWRVAFL